jgi:hypothetical protein
MLIPPPGPLSQPRLITCILINQLATPGLGSLLARRKRVGTCQLLLALTGFVLICAWMMQLFYGLAQWQLDGSRPQKSYDWLWIWGSILFGASWLWAFVTSCSLLRQARRSGLPPKIPVLPPPKPGAREGPP